MIQTVTLIGAGNLASQLGKALFKAGIQIIQVYSRTEASAKELAGKLRSEYTNSLADLRTDADLLVFALKDDALVGVLQQLELKGKFIVHTAGSLPMEALKPYSDWYGVFYPLQTFSYNFV